MAFLTDEQKASCIERLSELRDLCFERRGEEVKWALIALVRTSAISRWDVAQGFVLEVGAIKCMLEIDKFLVDEFESGS
jgi:hypothetical protein